MHQCVHGAFHTAFAYDAAGNQTNVTDALTHITEFRYDARQSADADHPPGRRHRGRSSPTASLRSGEPTDGRNQRAWILSLFGYDGVGRLLSVTNGLNSGSATNWATYAYDEAEPDEPGGCIGRQRVSVTTPWADGSGANCRSANYELGL